MAKLIKINKVILRPLIGKCGELNGRFDKAGENMKKTLETVSRYSRCFQVAFAVVSQEDATGTVIGREEGRVVENLKNKNAKNKNTEAGIKSIFH